MNTVQKIITSIALMVFLVTCCSAPWSVDTERWATEFHYRNESAKSHFIQYSPLWDAPSGDSITHAALEIGILFAWWFAIAVIFGALFLLFRTKKNPPK
jgi:hypothetical protein